MKHLTFFDQVVDTLGDFAQRHDFTITVNGEVDNPRGITVILENDSFIVSATRERTFIRDEETIYVHCKMRPRPRAHLRQYAVGDLSAFIEGKLDPYPVRDFSADAKDLLQYEDQCLNVDLLNSEELRVWRVDASRRQFGQRPIRRKG